MKDEGINNLALIKELFIYFLIAALIILVLVSFYTIYYSWKYRKKGEEKEPEQIHENRKFEFWMIFASFAVVCVLFIFAVGTMKEIQDIPEKPEPDLIITGHQWWWEAEYTQSGLVTANEIHIPAGEKVLLQLNSEDVIHSWWVPKLGRKMDLIPGRDNYLWLYAEEPGEYRGSCSEFCGTQHAWMKIRLIVQEKADFEKWQNEQLSPALAATDSLSQKGQMLFNKKTCVNCHSVHPQMAKPNIGPNLAHFASRDYFLSNIKVNNTENLRAWLDNPDEMKSSTKMPNLILNQDEITALTHYLQNLK